VLKSSWRAVIQKRLKLQRRLEQVQANTISVAAHPGYAATSLQRRGPEMSGASLQGFLMSLSNLVFAQSAKEGALPTLYAATAPGVKGGEYYGPIGFLGMRGYPEKVHSSERSYDSEIAERLWEVSEQMTTVHFTLEEAESRA
jgi:hypothetical protein